MRKEKRIRRKGKIVVLEGNVSKCIIMSVVFGQNVTGECRISRVARLAETVRGNQNV